MAEQPHTHSKNLTLQEQMEASTYRLTIVEVVNRHHYAYEKFRRSHNSGYCAYELLKNLKELELQSASLRALLIDLGAVEHYNFEAYLAILDNDLIIPYPPAEERSFHRG